MSWSRWDGYERGSARRFLERELEEAIDGAKLLSPVELEKVVEVEKMEAMESRERSEALEEPEDAMEFRPKTR